MTDEQIEPHCCETRECQGLKYHQWSLNCRFCKNKIFIECLRNRDTFRTKELLLSFGLMCKQTNPDGSTKWLRDDTDPDKLSTFNHIFNVDSPFGIVCDICFTKFSSPQNNQDDNGNIKKTSHNDNTSEIITNDTLVTSIIESVSKSMKEVLNGNIFNLDASLSSDSRVVTNVKQTVQQIVPPKQGEDGLFSLYVSKADTKATEDSIVSYILDKIDISTDVFKVIKLNSRRKYHKSYTAFKLISFTEEVSNLFCKPDIWSDEFRVRAFAVRKRDYQSRKFVGKRNENNRNPTKTTNQYKKNQSNTNHNVHSYRNTTKLHSRDGKNTKNSNRFNNKHQQYRSKFTNMQHNRQLNQYNRYGQPYQLRNSQMSQMGIPQMNSPAPFWYQMPYLHPPPQQQIHLQQSSPPFHHFQAPQTIYQPFNIQHQPFQTYTMQQPT